MNSKDKFQDFQNKYPNLFREYPRSGFSVNDGWVSLVDKLCAVLEHHIVGLTEDRESKYCVQCKEKFAGLRFYMHGSDLYIDGAIALAETLSFSICQKCGSIGSRHTIGGWIATLCDLCKGSLNEEK